MIKKIFTTLLTLTICITNNLESFAQDKKTSNNNNIWTWDVGSYEIDTTNNSNNSSKKDSTNNQITKKDSTNISNNSVDSIKNKNNVVLIVIATDSTSNINKPIDSLAKSISDSISYIKIDTSKYKKTEVAIIIQNPLPEQIISENGKPTYNLAYIPTSQNDIIRPDALGPLVIGMSTDSVKAFYPKYKAQKGYIYQSKIKLDKYQIFDEDKNPVFSIIPNCDTLKKCTIARIIVDSDNYKTDRDITVGMTLDDLILAYGYLTPRWEKEMLCLSNTKGIDFILDTSKIPRRWYRTMSLDRLPLTTKIRYISIDVDSGYKNKNNKK